MNRFDPINVAKAIKQYHLGNSKLWKGASVLWYINTNQKITTGKIMLFNQDTSKRVTKPFHHINWVHNVLGIPNENINKCLFGEHLLDEFRDKPVAIVESEKTAIIASICLPDFIWMATGGVGNLSYERLKPLKNKKIVLFPDLDAYDIWLEKANYFKQWFSISVSNYLEVNASDLEKSLKYDIADYLLETN